MGWPLKLQGRFVTEAEVTEVRMLLQQHPTWNRTRLSQVLCERWHWRRPDGQMKDMACREMLRKLETRTLITLPPSLRSCTGRPPVIEPIAIDSQPVACSLADIQPISIVNARDCVQHEKAFNYLLKEYHYLSYARPVGQNMKYLILDRDGRFLGCLLFGAAAWKMAPRDRWIGWSVEQRERNLGLICNNTRFLILDWIKVPHLASHVLSTCQRRLSRDWQYRYGTGIRLVETFVDTTRYAGTCYKAANWCKLGQTKGRGRQDRDRKIRAPIKDIFVYPLNHNFRQLLHS